VLVSALITYDIYDRSSQFSELTVEEGYSSSPLVFGKAMEGRLAMQVDGKTVQSLTAYYYTIRNTGRSPIRKSDYDEPIRVSVEQPVQLLAVDTAYTNRDSLKPVWQRDQVLTNTFILSPTLLNQGDIVGVYVFTTNSDKSDNSSKFEQAATNSDGTKPSWTARIANISSIKFQPLPTSIQEPYLFIAAFDAIVRLQGGDLYSVAGITLMLFVSAILLSRRFNRLPVFSFFQIFLVIIIALLSFTSAEFVYELLILHEIPYWTAWPFFILHLVLLTYLTWPALKPRLLRLKTSPSATQSPAP
jgi:hypothetical protein